MLSATNKGMSRSLKLRNILKMNEFSTLWSLQYSLFIFIPHNSVQKMSKYCADYVEPFLACYSGWDQWTIKLKEPYQEKKESKAARLWSSMCVLADVLFLIELYSVSGLEPDINHQLRQHSTTSHFTGHDNDSLNPRPSDRASRALENLRGFHYSS